MTGRCEMELCPNWAGDDGCPCAVLGLPKPTGGDLAPEHEWYPRECALCTREAALACTDPSCRSRRLGEDYDPSAVEGGGVV